MKIWMMLGVFFITFAVNAQGFTSIGNALQSGNASEVAKFFDTNVELTILNTEAVYKQKSS
ncbi:MAG: DUF4783 domain-containing protein [Chitinophagales bacterium]|nr:DUF4783 domain-containing protein [Chitinophagales bacterium]